MTGSMSRYLAIPEQTPAMILLFGSRLSSFFHMIYLRMPYYTITPRSLVLA